MEDVAEKLPTTFNVRIKVLNPTTDSLWYQPPPWRRPFRVWVPLSQLPRIGGGSHQPQNCNRTPCQGNNMPHLQLNREWISPFPPLSSPSPSLPSHTHFFLDARTLEKIALWRMWVSFLKRSILVSMAAAFSGDQWGGSVGGHIQNTAGTESTAPLRDLRLGHYCSLHFECPNIGFWKHETPWKENLEAKIWTIKSKNWLNRKWHKANPPNKMVSLEAYIKNAIVLRETIEHLLGSEVDELLL